MANQNGKKALDQLRSATEKALASPKVEHAARLAAADGCGRTAIKKAVRRAARDVAADIAKTARKSVKENASAGTVNGTRS